MTDRRRLKILEVCTVPTEKSGIPNVAFNLMRNMDREDIEIGYVAINEPSDYYKEELEHIGATLYVIPRKLSSPWKYVVRLATVARGYDIIHVHGNSATMVLEMIAAKMAGVKVRAAHSHNSSCRMKWIDKMSRPLFYMLCNTHLACGEAAGKWLFEDRGFDIIKNGIQTSRFAFDGFSRKKIRDDLGIKDEVILANIANFVEVKNHSFLLGVFAEILKKRDDVRLMLVGGGDLLEDSKGRAEELGIIDKVIFSGSVNNPEEFMSASDYIIMPSKYEGLPLTLVEEQANGLSAIVSDRVSREADLTGELYFLSLDKGEKYWADFILDKLRNFQHDDVKSKASVAGIIAAGYDIKESAAELLEIFKTKSEI